MEVVGREVERLDLERKVLCDSLTPHLISTMLPFKLLVNTRGLFCRCLFDDPPPEPLPYSEARPWRFDDEDGAGCGGYCGGG